MRVTAPLLVSTAISLSLAAAPAWAAEQPAADTTTQADAADEESGIGEIIVTATKRAENQQEVPIAISAFDAKTVQTLGIQSTVDLPQVTPGLSLTRTLVGANAFLRGVGTTSAGYSTELPIATYVDGLYLPNSAAASFSFNNIERIEVLKGPQGTLYGRNSTGGLIHVITKEPGLRTEVDVSAQYENFDRVQLNAYASTPVSDTLSANVAAVYINQTDGWGRNAFTGSEVFKLKDFGVQGKLKWEPGPNTTITLRGFYDKVETDQGNAAYIFPGSVGADGSVYLGEYLINQRLDPRAKQRQAIISLKAQQDVGFATLTSITGYINNRSPSLQVQSANLGILVPGRGAVNLGGLQTAKTWSQEFQLASNPSESPFKWIVGAFFYRDSTIIQTDVYGTCIGTTCVPPPPTRTRGHQLTRSASVFGEGTYDLTPSTHVTLGLRYTRDKKSLDGTQVPLAGFPNSLPLPAGTIISFAGIPFAGAPNGIDTQVTFPKMTFKAVLAQDFGEDIHGYVSFNRGFKSGGYNPISFTNPPSRPEVLDAYEAGVKSELFDRMLRLNVAGFYYDYKDIQLRSTAPPAPPGGSLLINAASAHIKGVDVDFLAAPVRGLTINGGFEVLDAKYEDFPAGVCTTPIVNAMGVRTGGFTSATCNLAGRRLPSAPKFSYSLGFTYEFDTSIGNIALNANDGYKSDYFWEPDNRLKQDSFHIINASITWTEPSGHFSLQGYVRNLADEYYYSSAAEGTGGNDAHLPAAPRTYGVKARYRF